MELHKMMSINNLIFKLIDILSYFTDIKLRL